MCCTKFLEKGNTYFFKPLGNLVSGSWRSERNNFGSLRQLSYRLAPSIDSNIKTSPVKAWFSNRKIYNNKPSNLYVVLVDEFDIFDRVNKNRLPKKLQRYGIRGKLLQWIDSYLTKRTQMVEIES